MTSDTSTPAAARTPAPPSAWSPLRQPVFRALWFAQFASNVGSWMQTVGAQWLLIAKGAALLSLVQVAAGLPVLILALPAGVLADLVDRRRLLLGVQGGMAAVAAVLTVLAFAGHLGPWTLLALTFLLGCGGALNGPAWQALQPTLVPRDQLRPASALGAVNQNVARAVGPALGGLLVAAAGVGWTFALNTVSFAGILVVLARWRPARPAPRPGQEREQAVAALRAGTRYVSHSPRVRRILLRSALFVPGAAALWALIPLTAHQTLHMGSAGYGLLLAAVGFGAVGGAWALPRVSGHLGGDWTLALSNVLFAAALLAVDYVADAVVAFVALVIAGTAWIWALSTLNAALQLGLPAWVRARAVAFYLLVFQGGMAIGALVWGQVAQWAGLSAALVSAAVLLVAGAATVRLLPLRDRQLDTDAGVTWPEPRLELEPAPTDGPVMVTVEYLVPEENAEAFRRAMARLERTRRRTGATTWGLYRDPEQTDRYQETFTVRSWAEHMAQHHERYTGSDQEAEADARALAERTPEVRHALMQHL
ncbi:putative MFS family arabinose efflux permease [Catenulispora sp. EB89]|uniref:MFS transporter n=1 Tax=Catenulispora sp. EB89 TaxID=3156257 RepID=UPI0035158B1C